MNRVQSYESKLRHSRPRRPRPWLAVAFVHVPAALLQCACGGRVVVDRSSPDACTATWAAPAANDAQACVSCAEYLADCLTKSPAERCTLGLCGPSFQRFSLLAECWCSDCSDQCLAPDLSSIECYECATHSAIESCSDVFAQCVEDT